MKSTPGSARQNESAVRKTPIKKEIQQSVSNNISHSKMSTNVWKKIFKSEIEEKLIDNGAKHETDKIEEDSGL